MIGSRIAALRKQQGYPQQELARLLEVSPSAIGMYEQGRREPPLRLIVAMSRLFHVSIDFLVTGACVTPADELRLRELFDSVLARLDGDLLLKDASGNARPVSQEDVALAMAAVLDGTSPSLSSDFPD